MKKNQEIGKFAPGIHPAAGHAGAGECCCPLQQGGTDQNDVQHKPPGYPNAVYQQSASPGGLYDTCKGQGNIFTDLGLFLQNQRDEVTENG